MGGGWIGRESGMWRDTKNTKREMERDWDRKGT
jgi:hypothetical protein